MRERVLGDVALYLVIYDIVLLLLLFARSFMPIISSFFCHERIAHISTYIALVLLVRYSAYTSACTLSGLLFCLYICLGPFWFTILLIRLLILLLVVYYSACVSAYTLSGLPFCLYICLYPFWFTILLIYLLILLLVIYYSACVSTCAPSGLLFYLYICLYSF